MRRLFSLRRDDPAKRASDELRFHFESRIDELVREGLTPADARARALEEFGDVEATRQELEAIDRRMASHIETRERSTAFGLELRLALRRLLRHPGFSVPTISTLALGLGTAAVVFVLLHTVVLRPLPYPDADRLVRIRSSVPAVGGSDWNVAKAEFLYFRREAKSLEQGGLYLIDRAPVSVGSGLAVDVSVAVASAGVAPVLGARAALGRLLRESDGLGATNAVVVLTDGFWRSFYGGDADVLGKTLRLNGVSYEVVGVMEPGVKLPDELEAQGVARIDIWVPLKLDPAERPQNSHVFNAIARIGTSATLAGAQAELAQLTTKLPDVLPEAYTRNFMTKTGFTTRVTLLRDDIMGGMDRVLWILFGAGLLVLAVAAANTTNLFLARFETRRGELAVREALGAGRGGLVKHLLVEAVVLGLAAGALALVLAIGGVRLFAMLAPEGLPRAADAAMSVPAVLFTLGAAVLAGMVAGLLPLARNGRTVSLLGDSMRGTPAPARHRARRGLVVLQMALSLVLLAGAGLLVRSWSRLLAVDPGFDATNVMTFTVALPRSPYGDPGVSSRFYLDLASSLEGMPGVQAAGLASSLPLSGFDGCNALEPEGLDEEVCMAVVLATPGYLGTLGIPVRGELPSRTAAGRARVVVNETMAQRHWPGRDATGRWISQSEKVEPEVVSGVAGDVRYTSLERDAAPTVYFPVEPTTQVTQWLPLIMRAVVRVESGTPAAWAGAFRDAVSRLDPNVAMLEPRSMEEGVSRSLARRTSAMSLLLVAALVASVLAMLGLYAVVSYLVTERQREIGIRLALGARAQEVGRLVQSQSARLALLGLALGGAGAIVLTRLLSAQLFGVAPTDPVALGGAALVLAVLAVIATWLPARRATKVDPIEALRS
jgi:putative ABC transport system permease protein